MTLRLAAALAVLAALPAAAQERTYIDVGSPDFQPLPIAVAISFLNSWSARKALSAR